jgi:hypothetical protein
MTWTMRTCARCEYIYFSRISVARDCPICRFGSYDAIMVYGKLKAYWNWFTQFPHKRKLRSFRDGV